MTETTTADMILGAIESAEFLWPHNAEAIDDIGVEMAVLAALGKPTDAPSARALLRHAGSHPSPVRALFRAVYDERSSWTDHELLVAPCDRCAHDVRPSHTLRVPAGATVVELHCCDRCRHQLDAGLSGLVWS